MVNLMSHHSKYLTVWATMCFNWLYYFLSDFTHKKIMKLFNLHKHDFIKLFVQMLDPYVKIYSMHGGKRLDKKKTTIKRRNKDPVWNESFIFHVPVDKLRDITFVFTVMDYDRVTQNEMIGQVILGYRTTGTSLRHWTDMMGNPRKPVAQWHRLQLYWC